MRRQQSPRRQVRAEAAPMDPVALSVAIWLGLVATVVGLSHLAQTIHTPTIDAPPAMISVY